MRSIISLAIVFIISFTVGGIYCKSDVKTNEEKISNLTTSTTEIKTEKETETEVETEITTITETTTEATVEETTEATTKKITTTSPPYTTEDDYVSPAYFRKMGRIYGNGYWWTWYSERVLPGGGLDIPGRHSDGNYVRDEDEYIVLASPDLEAIPKGTILETPFGMGKVYDHNENGDSLDVYTSF